MPPFTIEAREAGKGIWLVKLAGRLNAASAPETKGRLKALAEPASSRMVLDLSELSFIDSSGLSALVSAYKAAVEAGGALKLAGLGGQAAEVFALTHLDRIFDAYPDPESALAAFGDGG